MMEPDEFDMAGFAVGRRRAPRPDRRRPREGRRRGDRPGLERRRTRTGSRWCGACSSAPASRPRRRPRRAGRRVRGGRAAGADPHLRRRGAAADRHPRRARDGAHHRRRHPRQPGRPLPDGLGAEIDLSSWERPAVFTWLASLGVDEDEMRRVFNLGLGYAVGGRRTSRPNWRCGRWSRRASGLGGGPAGRGRRSHPAVRVGVLISGTGSNLQALIDDAGIDVACVVSDRPQAPGLERRGAGRHRVAGDGRRGGDRGLPRTARGGAGGAGRLHADPVAGVRAPLLRPHHERAPVAAAGVPGRARGRATRWSTACA